MEKRIKKIIEILEKEYPHAKSALEYKSPFQMLVATILSAQTTDERVNKVTPGLFMKFKSMENFADAPLDEIREEIKSVNFYRNKANNIKKLSQMIIKDFNGKFPDSMEKLIMLPGVARKTANVVLGEVFGKAEGFVVDTHVKRLACRLGLTENTTPEKIELDIMKLVPREKWISLSMELILHGRKICKAKKPMCQDCRLKILCPSACTKKQ
ncbi:MAG TPA: endonuclease III [bacterium]|nr:endonuclease III [bacterium]